MKGLRLVFDKVSNNDLLKSTDGFVLHSIVASGTKGSNMGTQAQVSLLLTLSSPSPPLTQPVTSAHPRILTHPGVLPRPGNAAFSSVVLPLHVLPGR